MSGAGWIILILLILLLYMIVSGKLDKVFQVISGKSSKGKKS